MYKLDIVKKFKNDFENIISQERKYFEALDYFKNTISKKKSLNVTVEEKKDIIKYFDFLRQYNQEISSFLGNQKYDNLVKENYSEFISIINHVKKIQINNGLLIESYQRIINARPTLFMNYFNGKIEKYGTYDRDINNQFRKSTGYSIDDKYSISEFYRWVTTHRIVGNSLINELEDLENQYNLTFVEVNKGLYDSLFIGNNKWKLITPNSYTFDDLDKKNIINGKLVYECGIQIKDNYKTLNIPSNLDTFVLHNPYSLEEIDVLTKSAGDYNIVLSFYGLKNDLDYREKIEYFNRYLAILKEDKSNLIIEENNDTSKQFVNTIISLKK